jgi:hypothetical protein
MNGNKEEQVMKNECMKPGVIVTGTRLGLRSRFLAFDFETLSTTA